MSKKLMTKDILLGAILPLLLVAGGLGLVFGLKAAPPEENKLPPITPQGLMPVMPIADVESVHSLSEKSQTLDIEINGTVVPFREIELAAEAAGRIIEKDPTARSGNYVKQGQILFRIDPRDYELEVERLIRKRDQELAAVEELNLDIENSKLILEVAEEELKLASDEVKRLESIGRNFSSAAELDQVKRSRLTSLNQRVSIQNQIRAQESRRSRLELAAKLAETELEQAKLDLQRTVIRSPVDGRVVRDQVEADSYVQRGTPLVMIEDTSKVEVACNIRMDQLYWILDQAALSAEQLVNAAQAARYELPPTQVEIQYHVTGRESFVCKWEGVLDRFEGAGLDPQSRTIPIRIRVDHPERVTTDSKQPMESGGPPMLVRGMYVQATIKAKPATNLMLVPKLGIKPSSGSNIVWKFTPDDQAMFETTLAKRALAAESERAGTGASSNPNGDGEARGGKRSENSGGGKAEFDPDDWVGGFLTIVENVRVVRAYWDPDEKIDYWVCEVPENQLAVNDQVVVTPLPKVKGDNRDPIRVQRSSVSGKGSKLAGKSPGGGRS